MSTWYLYTYMQVRQQAQNYTMTSFVLELPQKKQLYLEKET